MLSEQTLTVENVGTGFTINKVKQITIYVLSIFILQKGFDILSEGAFAFAKGIIILQEF